MNKTDLLCISKFIDSYKPYGDILEVGSNALKQNISAELRSLFCECSSYTGIDLQEGKYVEHVLADPYKFPFKDNSFDVALCVNLLEHVTTGIPQCENN